MDNIILINNTQPRNGKMEGTNDERVAEMDYLIAVLSKEHDDVKVADRIAHLAHSLAASGKLHREREDDE